MPSNVVRAALLASVLLALLPAVALAETATVTQTSSQGLVTSGLANASLSFGTPPAAGAPAEAANGAIRLATGAPGFDPLTGPGTSGEQELVLHDTPFNVFDVQALSYSTVRTTVNGNAAVELRLDVQVPGHGTVELTYRPSNSGTPVTTDEWRRWDAFVGGAALYTQTDGAPLPGGLCSTTCMYDAFAIEHGSAEVRAVKLGVGAQGELPWNDFVAWVDDVDLLISGSTVDGYDFADTGSTTIPVGGTGLWQRISNAENAADDGDTIEVAAGEYEDQVVLDGDVTLSGAGSGETTITGETAFARTFTVGGETWRPIVTATEADGATVEDLAIDGEEADLAGYAGVGVFDSDATVQRLAVRDVGPAPPSASDEGVGIVVADGDTSEDAPTVRQNVLTTYRRTGIDVRGAVDATIRENSLNGSPDSSEVQRFGIRLRDGARADVIANTANDHDFDGAGTFSVGLMMEQAAGATVTGNTFADNDAGVIAFGVVAPVVARLNRIAGNTTGSIVAGDGSEVDADDNWWGCNGGPTAPGCTPNVEVNTGNIDVNRWLVLEADAASGDPVERGGGTRTISARLRASDNTPVADLAQFPAVTIAWNVVGGTADPPASAIEFGDPAQTTFRAGLPATPQAEVHAVLDAADEEVALTLSDDQVTLVAFEDPVSDAGGCGAPANPCAEIEAGVDAADPGDTVQAGPGAYSPATIDKAVTLLGAQAGVAPRTRDLDPDDETALMQLNVTATATIDGIFLIGMSSPTGTLMDVTGGSGHTIRNSLFVGGGLGIGMSSPGTGTVIEDNGFSGNGATNGGRGGIEVDGGPGAANLTVRDNLFVGQTWTQARAVDVSGVDGVQVIDNAFRTLASAIGVEGSDDVLLTGNTGEGIAAAGVSLAGDDGVTMTGNRFERGPIATGTGLELRAPASSGVVVTGNTITGFQNGVSVNDASLGDPLELHFNRIVDIEDAPVSSGAAGAPVDAENNWWGCNEGLAPTGGCDAALTVDGGVIDADPHLQLSLTADPVSIPLGGTSALTASLRRNSAGAEPAGNTLPDGIPVVFATDAGTLEAAATTLDGAAGEATLNGGAAMALASPSVTVDDETVTASVRIGDADGDGVADAGDCAPQDAVRPAKGGTDANCDGKVDETPGGGGGGGGGGAPAAPGGPSAQPGPPAAAPLVLRAGLPRGAVKVRRGLLALGTFTCSVRCTITPTVTLVITPKGKRAKAKRVRLRAGALGLQPNLAGTLRARVSAKTQRLLRRAKAVRAEIATTTSAPGAPAQTRRFTVKVAPGR